LPVLDEFYQKVKAVYPHSVEKTHLHTVVLCQDFGQLKCKNYL